MKTLLKNGTVAYGNDLVATDVLFDESGILKIEENIEDEADDVLDCTNLAVLPGLIDVHVHLREPGFEAKETIETGSKAAARGGFTTIMAMPNVNPYPDNKETMEKYLTRIAESSVINVIPYGTITCMEKGEEVSAMKDMKELGVRWFSDDGVGVANDEVMEKAMREAAALDALIASHTEDMRFRIPGASVHEAQYAYEHGWIGIPSDCESSQLTRDLALALKTQARYHGCHISAMESVEALRRYKVLGADISAEVTAHHLLLENTDVMGPNWKMNPPLRSHADRMSLIHALESGVIDFIASDHAPHTFEDKDKPMAQAAFGIVSLETSFALLYSEFVKRTHRWTLPQLVSWMSEKPAKRFGFKDIGVLKPSYKADIVVMDLISERVIHASQFQSKGKNTPFDGWTTWATVKRTYVNGKLIYKEGEE